MMLSYRFASVALLALVIAFAVQPSRAQRARIIPCDPDCNPTPTPLPQPTPTPAPPDLTFDATAYENIYPDLKNVYGNNLTGAAGHYQTTGLPVEGRRGGIIFDPVYYLQNNPDLLQAFGPTGYQAAANHFINQGLPVEGRRGSLEFDVKYYLQNNSDLLAAFGPTGYISAAQHFLIQGLPNEGRRGSADVDVKAYANNYPDVQAIYGQSAQYLNAMFHWLRRGKAEGRVATGSPVTTSPDCTASTPPLIPGTNTPFQRVYIGLTGHDGSGTSAGDPRDGTQFDAILRSYSGDPAAGIPATTHLVVCILSGTYLTDGTYNWVINIPHNSEVIQNRGFAIGPYWHIHGNGAGQTTIQLNSYYVPPAGGELASQFVATGTNVVFSTGDDNNPGVEISDLTIDDNYPNLKTQAGSLPLRLEAIHLRDFVGGHYIHRVNVINSASESGMGEAFPVWIASVAYSQENHASPTSPPSQDNTIEFVTMSQWHGVACTAITMAFATGNVQYNVVNGYQIGYGGWELPFVPATATVPAKFTYFHDNFSLNTVYGFNIDSEYNDSVNIQFNEIINPQLYGIVMGGGSPLRFNNFTLLYNEIVMDTAGAEGVILQGDVTNSVVARTNFLAGATSGVAINLFNPGNSENAFQDNQIYSGFSIAPAIKLPVPASCVFGNWDQNGTQRSDFTNNVSTPCRPGL